MPTRGRCRRRRLDGLVARDTEGYADRVLVHRKENCGTASALNLGARKMSGDWFKRLDADDALKPHAVASLVGAARLPARAARRPHILRPARPHRRAGGRPAALRSGGALIHVGGSNRMLTRA